MSETNKILNVGKDYVPGELIFGRLAKSIVDNGWSIFPQDAILRRPGKVNDETIEWSKSHDLKNRLPTSEALDSWIKHCATLNVACVFGPASGNTFAIDIDVTNEEIADDIADIANDVFGYTPLRRVGRYPKLALIYRADVSDNDLERVIPNMSRHFTAKDEDGNQIPTEDGLEIQSSGKLLTFFGIHHKTGRYFEWTDKSPLLARPEDAPLVKPEQVVRFIELVDEKYPFFRGNSYSSDAMSWQWDDDAKKMVSKIKLAGGGTPWSENHEGKIIDGREAYLLRLVYQGIRNFMEPRDHYDAGYIIEINKKLCDEVSAMFQATAVMGGRWTLNYLRSQVKEKVFRLVQQVVSGSMKLYRPLNNQIDKITLPEVEKDELNYDLSFYKGRNSNRKKFQMEIGPGKETKEALAIPDDRSEIETTIQNGLSNSFQSFFKDVYGHETGIDENNIQSRIHILKAPTGAGKTSRCIRTVAQDPRTFMEYPWRNPENGKIENRKCPIVILLPTYHNIDELRERCKVLNLDGNLNDEELRNKATEWGLISEDELDGRLQELRRDALNCGLETMVYSGKIRAGCLVADKVQVAMNAGVGTSAFCKTQVYNKSLNDGDGGMEDVHCEHYDVCPAITQRQKILESHVVFLPHSFMALELPEELKIARAVIADERIHHLFLHTTTFRFDALTTPRTPPKLTMKDLIQRQKDDNDETITFEFLQEEFASNRNMAVEIVSEAFQKNVCPAQLLFENPIGFLLVSDCIKICENGLRKEGNITPSMTIDEVRVHCAKPTGRELREESRFWEIIMERMQLLNNDNLRKEAILNVKKELDHIQSEEERFKVENRLSKLLSGGNVAKGDRDYRIQFLIEEESNGANNEIIRISWRTQPNWLGLPMLLLDASAAPEIIAKIWHLPEKDVIIHDVYPDIGKSLNVNIVAVANETFANSSIIAQKDAPRSEQRKAMKKLLNVRNAINLVSSMYGYGRVVAGASIALREVINTDWPCPENVDWCHFGAMRGLDMFKFHSAAISFGRMEVPIRNIDGLVASLTYDDDVPEKPLDIYGNGKDEKKEILRIPKGEQAIRLREGRQVVMQVPMYPGKWGRLIQRQYREEELLQFVGRLRPVYRKGQTPVWFALSSIIPEELIVDDVIHIDDLLFGKQTLWEASRRTGGVLHPYYVFSSASDLFKDINAVKKTMNDFGMPTNISTEEEFNEYMNDKRHRMPKRTAEGYACYFWKNNDPDRDEDEEIGDHGLIYIRADIKEDIAFQKIRDALYNMEVMFSRKEDIEIKTLWRPKDYTLARSRQDDTVDERMGDRKKRKEREKKEKKQIGGKLLKSKHKINATDLGIHYEMENEGVYSFPELFAQKSIETYWRRKGRKIDESYLPVINEEILIEENNNYDNYDIFGNIVKD